MNETRVPDRPGWYRWRRPSSGKWECARVRHNTLRGELVVDRVGSRGFPCPLVTMFGEWGDRIPMPDEEE